MVLPADGGARAEAVARRLHAVDRRAGVVAGRARASRRSIADPSVTDPELEPVKPGMYTTAQPFMDLYRRAGRRLVEEPHRRRSTIRSAIRCGAPTARRSSSAPSTTRPTTRRCIATRVGGCRSCEPLARGQESFGRCRPTAAAWSRRSRTRRGPTDLWMLGASEQRTRITDLNPQLARFTFSKPELFYFDNADGERLGALLYKPAGLRTERQGAGDHVGLREDDAGASTASTRAIRCSSATATRC